MASIYKMKTPDGTEYDITDAKAVHATSGTVNENDITQIPNSVMFGDNSNSVYINHQTGGIDTTGDIWVGGGEDIIGDSLNIRNGYDINLTPSNGSTDSGDIVFYYDYSMNHEKGRIYMSDNPTNVNEAAPSFRAKKADGTSLIDTKLLTRKCITAISNSVRWKSTTTTFSQVSGLSFSIPAYSVAIVTAQQIWSNAIPRAIGIGTGTGGNLVALNTNTSDDVNLGGCHISTTATIINSGSSTVTYNIYCTAKTVSTAGNDVRYKGIIIPYKP